MAAVKPKSVKNQKNLHRHAAKPGSVYVGSTVNPQQRAQQHTSSGFSGQMYFAKTSNMKQAENKLLGNGPRHNSHTSSNAAASPGYVYVINGRKKRSK